MFTENVLQIDYMELYYSFLQCFCWFFRDANAQPVTVDESDKEHKPTFTNNVQGVLRTKMEGGKYMCTQNQDVRR